MSRLASFAALAGTVVLGACAATPPSGPNVWVLPAEGKDLARFREEDAACRNYAMQQIGFGPSQQGPVSGSSIELQQRYDVAYLQCMAASGNKVPTTATGEPFLITPYASYRGGYPYYGYAYGFPGPYFGAGISLGFSGRRHFGHSHHHRGGFHHGGGFHHRGGFHHHHHGRSGRHR